jgi:hypothetical protein
MSREAQAVPWFRDYFKWNFVARPSRGRNIACIFGKKIFRRATIQRLAVPFSDSGAFGAGVAAS